jgi:Ca2+-binding EF-hand superfamily protein
MMNQLDIDDGDGFIDELEFIILMLVRLKAIRPELIATIIARFRVLDRDDKGAVPYEVFQFTDKRGSGASTSSVTTITECDIEL